MLEVVVLPQLQLEVGRLRDLSQTKRERWVVERVLVLCGVQSVPKRYRAVHILLPFPLVVAQPGTVLAGVQGIRDV